MRKFIGVDQSLTHTAVSVIDEAGNLLVATTLSVSRGCVGVERLDSICTRMTELLQKHGPTYAGGCIEGASYGSTHREFDLGEISGVIRREVYHRYSVDLVVVSPLEVKKFARGKGFGDKAQMLYDVKNKWGYDFGEDDNAADAFVLAQIARALSGDYSYKSRAEAEVAQNLRRDKPKRARIRKTTNNSNI